MERAEELSSQFIEDCVQVSSQSTVFKSVHRGLYSSQFTDHCVQVHRGLCSSQYQRTAFKAVHRGMCSKSSQSSVQVSSMKIVFKSVHRGLCSGQFTEDFGERLLAVNVPSSPSTTSPTRGRRLGGGGRGIKIKLAIAW